ncbi:MAG: ABC transporter substrate-binding protein [Spirulinaceae cyanobacterium SM2_1_0]|nr:ABC transporter substrate-binding protein [Spirulinaceae cyanobacterium SM2_1_0]
MKFRRLISFCALFVASLWLIASCNQAPDTAGTTDTTASADSDAPPLVLGYSNWAGWWPWAIAEEEGLFEANDANVELRWFDGYLESLQALAAGQIDANSQTLNDTIAFTIDSVEPQVVVLVNDNSAGNDKIIVSEEINTIEDLRGKQVALEEGLVDDFLLTLALEDNGMSREDVEIVNLETGAAAAAFASEQVDAVGAFPPFWLTALEREGSKELLSSAEYPGAIPDLLVVSQSVIEERPDQVQALVNTWFDVRQFMADNPERADEIMADRADVSVEEFQQFKEGTRFFTIEDNLEAFSEGEGMQHMPYAAERMTEFMLEVGLIEAEPELEGILDDRFVQAYAESQES